MPKRSERPKRISISEPKGVRGGGGYPGVIALARKRTLKHCEVYRAWRNQSGGDENRTVSVFPSNPTTIPQPPTATVTVFVAPDGHTGAPGAGNGPTPVGPNGDSIGKRVHDGEAIFVHLQGRAGQEIEVVVDDGP
jgi:hypothetical protein